MSRWPLSVEERFWSKVEGGDFTECWTWIGYRIRSGYGHFNVGDGKIRAHRWSYEALRAEIPAGLQLDHLCRNRACVNPWHLEPVTNRENARRGETGQFAREKAAASPGCGWGHRWSEENTYIAPRTGIRACRACDRRRARARKARAAQLAIANEQETP